MQSIALFHIPWLMQIQSAYLLMITIDVAAFMLLLTLVPTLTFIDAHVVTGVPVVLISALLGIILIAILVMVTVVVAFVVWKKKPGRCAFPFC